MLMILSVIPLYCAFYNLKKMSEAEGVSDVSMLNQEVKTLTLVFTVFTVGYTTRTFFDFAVVTERSFTASFLG